MPTTSTRVPGASSAAATTGEVITSAGDASTPTARRCAATCARVRVALLVTKATPVPAARKRRTASAAPGTGSSPRASTPSMSNATPSYAPAATTGGPRPPRRC